jgi:hypothetical protein
MTGERPFGDTPWKREFNVVYDAVIKAGMICERIATDNAINTATKSDDSPVTCKLGLSLCNLGQWLIMHHSI